MAIKYRKIKLSGHVARMEEMRNAHKSKNLNGRGHLVDIEIDRKMILKRILNM
jgi:hypothetical protein